MALPPLLHGEINFTDLKKETVKPSLRHSYRPPFKEQLIALPSHGQDTAAVELSGHRAGGTSYSLILQEAVFLVNRRGFRCLPSSFFFFWSFPSGTPVWGQRWVKWLSACPVVSFVNHFPLLLGPLKFDGGSGSMNTCAGRGSCPLITHSSIIASIGVWNGLVGSRGLRCNYHYYREADVFEL